MGFIKNKYIGRTFISPGQDQRIDQVRIKLNPIPETVQGKRVVLIDDSIVRGTTSGQIISLLRDAGAKEVHMRVSAPPFLNPCYYGTDIDSRDHLIACHRTIPEIADIIGADSLGYLPTGDLCHLIGDSHFCSACFDGNYPTTVPESTPERPLRASSFRPKQGAKLTPNSLHPPACAALPEGGCFLVWRL